MIFHQCFERNEGIFDLGFLFERIEPGVAGVMINKDEIVFELVNG